MALLTTAILLVRPPCVNAQNTTFSSGSDGSDGALDYSNVAAGTTVYFDPVALKLNGSRDQLCIFNFTTITIPKSVTVKLSANKLNCPIYWLASGDVDIEGTVDLSGAQGGAGGLDVDVRVPATPGSGGYSGGVGGYVNQSQAATAGNGPGGGAAGPSNCNTGSAGGGVFSGDQFLVPLVGGSGGGGINLSTDYGSGGGAGGGAILIASSTQIVVNGEINANGGNIGGEPCNAAGGGSGGAIRLVSNTISGPGTIMAYGGYQGDVFGGSSGRVRLEANTLSFNGSTPNTNVSESNPLLLELPSTPPSSLLVTSIAGTAITENPFSFPDITINNASSVPVIITGHQVPVGTVPTLYIFSEKADQVIPCAGGLQGTLATSTCTVSIAYPYGGSHGFVKATWSQ